MKADPWSNGYLPRNAKTRECLNHERCGGYAMWRHVYATPWYWQNDERRRYKRWTTIFSKFCSLWCARDALWRARYERGRVEAHPFGCVVCGGPPMWRGGTIGNRRYWSHDENFCGGEPPENFCARCNARFAESRVKGRERVWQYRAVQREQGLRPDYRVVRLLEAEWVARVRLKEIDTAPMQRQKRRLADARSRTSDAASSVV